MATESSLIFQSSDLANNRVPFLEAARAGEARLRDKDGTSLVMLPEQKLRHLEVLARWSAEHLRLRSLVERNDTPSVVDLGSLAWLRPFGRTDLREFVEELQDALIAATADGNTQVIDECVRAWRITASELEDPLRRSVLWADHSPANFVDADAPTAD